MEEKGNKIEIIAEIANAHQGDPKIALQLAQAAHHAHADAVKFQIYFADELLTHNHPRYDHFIKQAFTIKQWKSILNSLKPEVPIYADVFGPKALELAVNTGVSGLKIHSSDLTNTHLLKLVATEGRKVFLGAGGSLLSEITYAIDTILQYKQVPEIVLLHGFQAYPTALEDCALNRLEEYYRMWGNRVKLGYSDHCDGSSIYTSLIPLMSLSYKVKYLEKHITFNRDQKSIDYYSSIEPQAFSRFVTKVRQATKVFKLNSLEFSDAEQKYRDTVKKQWVYRKSLPKNHILQLDDITMKRTPSTHSSPNIENVVGKKLVRAVISEQAVSNSDYQHKILAIIVARLNSSRLPQKALLEINGKPAIVHLFERAKIALQKNYCNTIAFCTTTETEDMVLTKLAQKYPFKVYRGAIEDVLSRMMLAINDNPDHDIVLRITGDDLLLDSKYLKKTVNYHLKTGADYTDAKCLPGGIEVEAFNATTLKKLHSLSQDLNGTEYLTKYIYDNKTYFSTASLPMENPKWKQYRLTLDTYDDYYVLKNLLTFMKKINKEFTYTMVDIEKYFDSHLKDLRRNQSQPSTSSIIINTALKSSGSNTLQPKITIYITNHNYGKYIQEAIESVLQQKYKQFELLIIDDGSTDNSRDIIELYRENPRVKIIYQQNKGLNITNNIALNAALGKYIMRLDADDYLDENALLVMVKHLEDDPTLALVFPDYYLIDEKGKIFSQEKRHNFKQVSLKDQPAHGACTMIRKDVLLNVGGYSEEFSCQDGYDLWLKLINQYKVANIGIPLFYYRQHAHSLSKNEDTILKTRHEIIKKNISSKHIEKDNHIAIIPIRLDENKVPLCLQKFADTSLLDITLNSCLNTRYFKSIIVTTPSKYVYNYLVNLNNNKIVPNLRPEYLSSFNVKLEETLNYLIKNYTSVFKTASTISIVNFEYPLRKTFYLENAVNTLYLYELDSLISVKRCNANFYQHNGKGLVPFTSNNELRLERDAVYEEVGGIHTIRYKSYLKEQTIRFGKSGHIVIDDLSALKIEKEIDYKILEILYQQQSQPSNISPV